MTEIPSVAFPALYTLAQIYFSEDWPDFYNDDPLCAVEAFVKGHPGLSDQLPSEVEALVESEVSEAELGDLFRRIELLYDPPVLDHLSYRDWLLAVAERVREVLRGQG